MKRSIAVFVASAVVLIASALPASAHQHRPVGRFLTTVGWVDEPAYAGFRNAVQFRLEREVTAAAEDDHGHTGGEEEGDGHGHAETEPVENAELEVVVIFGDENGSERTEPMPLEPAFGVPGEYRAYMIPTQPGIYTFRITGTVGKAEIDEYYTSGESGANEESEGTFNDMRVPQDIQFPSKAPTDVELAAQVDDLTAVADSADSSAGTATVLAIIALLLALAAGALGVVSGRKKASA